MTLATKHKNLQSPEIPIIIQEFSSNKQLTQYLQTSLQYNYIFAYLISYLPSIRYCLQAGCSNVSEVLLSKIWKERISSCEMEDEKDSKKSEEYSGKILGVWWQIWLIGGVAASSSILRCLARNSTERDRGTFGSDGNFSKVSQVTSPISSPKETVIPLFKNSK